MLVVDSKTDIVHTQADGTIMEVGLSRVSKYEAMFYTQCPSQEAHLEAMAGKDDPASGFYTNSLFFAAVLEAPPIKGDYPRGSAEFALQCEAYYRKQQPNFDLQEYARKHGQKCATLLCHRDWEGIVYHFTRNADQILQEGWRPTRDDVTEWSNLSFGPGLYVYHRTLPASWGENMVMLEAQFRGDFYECVYYDDGDDHLEYGYIPYGYGNLRWQVSNRKNPKLDSTATNVFQRLGEQIL